MSTAPNVAVGYSTSRRRLKPTTIIRHVILILFCLSIVLPVAWVLLLSIKPIPDVYAGMFWPSHLDFSSYPYVIEHIPTLPQNMLNSIEVTAGTVIITSVCGVLGGYAMVHVKLPGRAILLSLLVASLYFPTRVVGLIAIFQIQHDLGLLNKTIGLILPYATLNLALSILIMRGIFEGISSEIVDAASIDGAGSWRTLWSVMLPLATNGVVVLMMVNFVTAWGEFLLAFTLTNDESTRTMPVVLAQAFGGMGQWEWPRIAAVYILVILPGIVAFALSHRWFFQGLQEGALKV